MAVYLLLSLVWVLTGKAYTQDLIVTTSTSLIRKWHDEDSGADENVSIWSVSNGLIGVCRYQWRLPDFYSIGDLVHNQWSNLERRVSIMVGQRIPGILKKPIRFERVWTDAGSGALLDVAVWTMVPPAGYTCLGAVAGKTHNFLPRNKNKYACVKDSFVVSGKLIETWNSKGSGANKDISLWTVVSNKTDGIDGGTFLPGNGWRKPSKGYTLKAENVNFMVPIHDPQYPPF